MPTATEYINELETKCNEVTENFAMSACGMIQDRCIYQYKGSRKKRLKKKHS